MAPTNGKTSWKTMAVTLSKRWNVSVVILLTFLTCLSFLRMTVVQQQLTVITRVFASRCSLLVSSKASDGFCSPSINVFFLKTHKCASSTVQNILMRYGDTRNLSFLLPTERNYIGNPKHFAMSMISAELTPSGGFNMFCHHTRFDRNEIRSALPMDTVFVTILRHPVALFESLYGYYNAKTEYGTTLEEFMDPSVPFLREKMNKKRFMDRIGPNQMLFDMGYSAADWEDPVLLQMAIREVNETFDLVMIAELFDESLILLKHRLCWQTSDIVYYTHNQRSLSRVQNMSSEVQSQVQYYNSADNQLYAFFRSKMEEAIRDFGEERMRAEVLDLRLWNKVWYEHCLQRVDLSLNIEEVETKAFNDQVYGFVLKKGQQVAEICSRLATAELPYTEKLRKNQRKLAAVSENTPCDNSES